MTGIGLNRGQVWDCNGNRPLRSNSYRSRFTDVFKSADIFIGTRTEQTYSTPNSEGKTITKIGKIAMNPDDYYYGKFDSAIQGFGGAEVGYLANTTDGMTSAAIEGSYKGEFAAQVSLSGVTTRFGIFSKMSGRADDVLAKDKSKLILDKGVHGYLKLSNNTYEIYKYGSDEMVSGKNYSAIKFDFTTTSGYRVSLEDKLRITDELRQKERQSLTQEEITHLLLDDLNKKRVTSITTEQQQDIKDLIWNKTQVEINNRPELNLTITDLSNIQLAIGEYVQGLNQIVGSYEYNSPSDLTQNKINLLQLDTQNDNLDLSAYQSQGSN